LCAAIRLNVGSAGASGTAERADVDIGRFGERWFWMELRRVFGSGGEIEGWEEEVGRKEPGC